MSGIESIPAQGPVTCDLSDDDTLYFMHIHKTAGSSLREYILEKFDRDQVSRFAWELPALLEQPHDDLTKLRALAGHYGYYVERKLGKRPVYVTMLRDPVERTLSAFSDQVWRKDLWLHDHIKDMTIDDYVFDTIGMCEVMNFQTRSLAFDDVERHFRGCAELWRDPERAAATYGDRALLDRARERLDRFAFVGVQDRFEEGLRLLAYTFGWPVPDRVPRENIRRKPGESLSPRTLERIREITALDQELYEHARRLFEERYAPLTDELIEQRHRQAMSRRPRVKRVCLRFENALLGAGWHSRTGAREWAGRWSGPGNEATLHFPLDPGSAYTLFMRVGAFLPEIVDELEVRANGRLLVLERSPCRDRPKHTALRAAIGPDVSRESPEYLELRLRTPCTVCPREHNPVHNDTRRLGVFVEALEMLPESESPSLAAWSDAVAVAIAEADAIAAGRTR